MTNGYAIVPSLLSRAETRALREALPAANARHLMSAPIVSELARDARLCALAAEALGGNATPFRATFFNKAPDANWLVAWHQDTALPLARRFDAPGWGPWSVKYGVHYAHAPADALEEVVALRVHLDDSLATNGPLRVVPDTHVLGVLSDDEVASIAHARASIECLVAEGGIVMMRPLLIHASAKIMEPKPRRVLHIEYAARMSLGEGIELAIT